MTVKARKHFVLFAAAILLIASCEDKERKYEDSPLITVNSPVRNQAIEDTDSVRVQAVIENKGASSIKSVSVWLLDNQKKYIYQQEWPCDCKDEKLMAVKTEFLHDVEKTSDLLLHVDALFEDGTSIREEVPFRLLDIHK